MFEDETIRRISDLIIEDVESLNIVEEVSVLGCEDPETTKRTYDIRITLDENELKPYL